MDLKQLEVFVNVINLKSFSKAAQKLYLTQPTISAHISVLERELGTRLIIRSSKEALPSDDGKILYEYARDMLIMRDNALAEFKNKGMKTVKEKVVFISASSIPFQYVLPPLLSEFRKENPDIIFNVSRGDSQKVIDDLLFKKAEIGMTGTVIEEERCEFTLFVEDRLVVITPHTPKYEKMKEEGADLASLAKEPFILREEGSGTRKETEAYFTAAGVDPSKLNISAQMDDTEAIKKSVSRGLGISVMSKAAAADYEAFGLIKVLDIKGVEMNRQLYIVSKKNHELSEAAEKFAAFAKKYYEK